MDDVGLIIFNIAVNIYQGFIAMYFLMNCMEHSRKYSKRQIYAIGTGLISTLFTIEYFITPFEGMWAYLFFVLVILLSLIFFEAMILQKIVYSVVVFAIMAFSGFLVGGLIGLIQGNSYVELVSNDTLYKYIAMTITQIVIAIIIKIVLRFVNHNKLGKSTSSTVLITLIVIFSSYEITILLLMITNQAHNSSAFYSFAIIVGIVALVALCLMLYRNAELNYSRRINQELQLQALREQQKDVELINYNIQEVSKVRHELNRVMNTVEMLLEDKKIDEAKAFIEQFNESYVANLKKIYYTNNTILNYIINRKVSECEDKNINIKCSINGTDIWLDDSELHCIVGNLLDNAIEAAQKSKKRQISLEMNSNDNCISIEVDNTVADNYVIDDELRTTKKDNRMHGYGIKNIRTIVEKYNGDLSFMQNQNRFISKILLIRT